MQHNLIGGRRATLALAALATAALSAPDGIRAQTAAYLDFDDLTSELRNVVGSSNAASMRSIATTREGRDVWLVEIGSPGGTPLDRRPAVLVVGNLEGDHLVGSALALEIVRHLTTAGGDAEVQRVLDEHTVYVVPRLNPDGAEAMFDGGPLQGRKGNARPYDDDNDGRVDEDGPEDLNGDGVVTVMRLADPDGALVVHPDDPRLLKEAEPIERETGQWTLYLEGVDSDGDGFINEDGPGGVDLNRNFQHEYPYWEADAGPHMVSEPETRALMDFAIAHPNVNAILTFGGSDNLIRPPTSNGALASARPLDLNVWAAESNEDVFDLGIAPGGGVTFNFRGAQPGSDNNPDSGRRPAVTVAGQDRPYFEAFSDAYREVTGIEEVGVTRAPEGAFFQFGYFQYGVPSFSTPGWALPEGGEGDGVDAEVLSALEGAGVDAFVDWTPFQHPTLGDVEIGGFRPYEVVNPPAAELPELGAAHGRFLVEMAGMLPEVGFAETEVRDMGAGLYRVTATVHNTGFLPTALSHGLTCGCVEPVLVQIDVPSESIVTGDAKTARVNRLAGSGGRETLWWLVRGSPGQNVEITIYSQKGARGSTTVTLR